MPNVLDITVVGGSVAGCAAAVELRAAGHRVDVHERAEGALTAQGIGIGVDRATLDRLVGRGLLEPTVPRVEARVIRYVHRAGNGERWIGDVPAPAATFNWRDLWAGLRARVPDTAYHLGSAVTVPVTGAEDHAEDRGLVVLADGHASTGRSFVSPDTRTAYQGLVLWRGLLPARGTDVRRLEGTRTRILYPGGHGVAYLLPGPDGAHSGERLLMWGFYLPLAPEELAAALTDRDGRQHTGSVGLGHTDDAVAASFRERLQPWIPDFYADLIARTPTTAVQAIVEVDPERSYRDRHCLVGDAGAVFSPFTGSGVLKAIDDVIALRESLDREPGPDAALPAWAAHRQTTVRRTRELAVRNRRALVDQVPDLATMTVADCRDWLTTLHPDLALRTPGGGSRS